MWVTVKLHSSCKIHCLGLPDVTSFLPALTSCTHKDNQFDYLCCLFNQQMSESGGKWGGKAQSADLYNLPLFRCLTFWSKFLVSLPSLMVKCVKKETDSTFSSTVESEALIHSDWPASNRLKVLFVKTARCVKMISKSKDERVGLLWAWIVVYLTRRMISRV